ncbi:MAG TPA: YbaN family protein [Acidimicrobiales bacterium]|nr:YbaN family protein [Acidimicrobiales bacterium]
MGPANEAGTEPSGTVRRGVVRWLWLCGGMISVGLGSLGIIVPGLPTTVFFILAAACFARSNPRFEQWVLDLPRIGRMVRDYRDGLGMSRRAKVLAVATILTVATASGVFAIDNRAVGAVVIAIGLVGAAYVGFVVPTRERVLAEQPDRAA